MGAVDRSEQHLFPGGVGEPDAVEGEARHPKQDDDEPEQCVEHSDPLSQLEDLLLQRVQVHVENIDGNDHGWIGRQPSAGGGPRDAVPKAVLDVARRSDEIA